MSDDIGKAALEEKTGHDKALEAYQAAYAKYTHDHTKVLDFIQTNRENKEQANQNFTNTEYAFKLYSQAHPRKSLYPKRLDSLTFISTVSSRNKASCFL